MKYSVIIPIYNAAATIGRCLESLLGQPHEEAEILLINDGSTDECGEICRNYARTHKGVRYFEKENGGVSSARNLGLEQAAGEYILFVDSDDYVTEDYFAVISRSLDRWDPDMLMFGLRCFGDRNEEWKYTEFCSENEGEIAQYVRSMSVAYLYSNLMTRSFRRRIIQEQNLRFREELQIGEDHAFIFAYTMYVKRMASVGDVIYRYAVENCNSLSRKNRVYLADQLLCMNLLMREALLSSGHTGKARRLYQETVSWSHYRSVYSACKELHKFHMCGAERRKEIRRICGIFCGAGVGPRGVRTWLIALPVIGRADWLIDELSAHSEFTKKLIS